MSIGSQLTGGKLSRKDITSERGKEAKLRNLQLSMLKEQEFSGTSVGPRSGSGASERFSSFLTILLPGSLMLFSL